MKAKTIRLTVLCPYCQTAATFRSEEKFKEWRDKGAKEPVHGACRIAKRFEPK